MVQLEVERLDAENAPHNVPQAEQLKDASKDDGNGRILPCCHTLPSALEALASMSLDLNPASSPSLPPAQTPSFDPARALEAPAPFRSAPSLRPREGPTLLVAEQSVRSVEASAQALLERIAVLQ
ncbi:hypothetical protein H632_c5397p0, partial [Helicosporidium sp. ATCC 50920]